MADKEKPQSWWHTDCEVCKRWRVILLWGIIMFLVYFYVWQ
jgi:hypothetical protein